jgi:diguanylate cyclase (GGDEF)-like protein
LRVPVGTRMSSHELENVNAQDVVASLRDRTADVRDAAATHRDTTADARDRVADVRDLVAGRRDAEADERDRHAATTAARIGEPTTTAHLRTALASRDAAAADRRHAVGDRAAWAADRVRAQGDRDRAEDDRDEAERDRVAAGDDRGSAAQDRRSADLDPLTGALHRGAGQLALRQEMTGAAREQHPLLLAFVDVDQMKAVNDTGGHSAGDQLLRHVVAALRAAFRPYDLFIRHGGDEFLCVLPGMMTIEGQTRMKQVNQGLAATDRPGSISAGFAQMHPTDTLEALINRADEDLYGSKAHRSP